MRTFLAVIAANEEYDSMLDIGTYDTLLREALVKCFYMYMHELNGGDGSAHGTVQCSLNSMKATTILLEPRKQRRAEMATHFDPPDAKDLAYNMGLHGTVVFLGCGSVTTRIGEACALLGLTDKALEYSSEEAYASTNQPATRYVDQPIARGIALARAGASQSKAAALASLEQALSQARTMRGCGVVLEMRALEALATLGLHEEGTEGLTQARTRLKEHLTERVHGTPQELQALFRDRDDRPTLDIAALLGD